MHKHSNNPEPLESKDAELSPIATVAMVTAVVGVFGLITSVF